MKEKNAYSTDMTVGDTFGKGWQLLRENMGLALMLIIGVLVIALPSNTGPESSDAQNLFATVYGIFVLNPAGVVAYWAFVILARGQDFKISDLLPIVQDNYLNLIGVTFLQSVIIGIGFILFILPGVYLAARLGYASYLCIDRSIGPIESLKASWELTRGQAARLIQFGIVAVLLILAGLLVLVVGVFVSITWSLAAFAILYNTLVERHGYISEAPVQ